jgi:hypothetical protein
MDESDRFDLAPFMVGVALGIVLMAMVLVYLKGTGYSLVTCPTEDSCEAQYDGDAGAWRIVPVIP